MVKKLLASHSVLSLLFLFARIPLSSFRNRRGGWQKEENVTTLSWRNFIVFPVGCEYFYSVLGNAGGGGSTHPVAPDEHGPLLL